MEHSTYASHQLCTRVGWEVLSQCFFVDGFLQFDDFLQASRRHVHVLGYALFFLDLRKALFEFEPVYTHDHITEHHDQAAIGIVDEALVAKQLDHALGDFIVHAEVEHGVHHAGHGELGARAD